MGETGTVWIQGAAATPFEPELPDSLEALIYGATAGALDDAQVPLSSVDAVCMAASDLFDGRGISTMTLTGATGSLGKSEIRVCDDGLAALSVGADEIAAGAAERVLVSAWSKLSDAEVPAIDLLGLEPAFLRPVGLRDEVLSALATSREQRSTTLVAEAGRDVGDGACALVLGAGGAADEARARLLGYGASTGAYARPGADPLEPASSAVKRALDASGIRAGELVSVHCGGFHRVDDGTLGAAVGLPDLPLARSEPRGVDFGYCGGLLALEQALGKGPTGPRLIIASAGTGLQKAYAAIVETR